MKDFNGIGVFIGDEVITMAKNYRSLVSAKVIGITDKTVLVEYLNTWNYGSSGRVETYRVDSSMFVIKGN